MMGLFIGLLTFVMVVDCLILIFLVLIQLPKKDAGAGLAFGAGATDALFGAGSGTVLTKITKYAAGGFFAMAILLSLMQGYYHGSAGRSFEESLNKASSAPTPITAPGSTSKAGSALPAATNLLRQPAAESTNVPLATNPAVVIPTN